MKQTIIVGNMTVKLHR